MSKNHHSAGSSGPRKVLFSLKGASRTATVGKSKDRPKKLKDLGLLKDEQVMEIFEISRSCVYQWRKKEVLPFIQLGSTHFYLEEVIIEMLYLRGGKIPEAYKNKYTKNPNTPR